jgi:YesN/AraC family two-component response regulator
VISTAVQNAGSETELKSLRSSSSFSLLLLEDDAITCEVIGSLITNEFPNITVYTADNGRTGVEIFKRHTPDIVITDINMPDMDGIQVVHATKSIRAGTKFIVFSGYSDDNNVEKLRRIGCNDYLVKPIDVKRLFSAIEKCCVEIMQQRK